MRIKSWSQNLGDKRKNITPVYEDKKSGVPDYITLAYEDKNNDDQNLEQHSMQPLKVQN